MNIKTETFRIADISGTAGIPAVLYGEPSDKVYLYLHGKHGRKEEALYLAQLLCEAGCQILAVDLPEHVERADDQNDLTASGAKKEC
ncbi:MAG: hypothetical protein IJX14_02115, partial [Clostridia bacterium]|nr:hypothetical protein [Clostridia bacterium]